MLNKAPYESILQKAPHSKKILPIWSFSVELLPLVLAIYQYSTERHYHHSKWRSAIKEEKREYSAVSKWNPALEKLKESYNIIKKGLLL